MQKAGQAHCDESKIVTTLQAYMLNTKVGRYEKEVENMFDYSAERVARSVEESLARMGLDYIDCIQVRHCVLRGIHPKNDATYPCHSHELPERRGPDRIREHSTPQACV